MKEIICAYIKNVIILKHFKNNFLNFGCNFYVVFHITTFMEKMN